MGILAAATFLGYIELTIARYAKTFTLKDDLLSSFKEHVTISRCSIATMSKKTVKGEYVETDTGNKVSRRSQISGTTNIILGGKTVIQAEVIIRGDLLRTYPTTTTTTTTTGASEKVMLNPNPNTIQSQNQVAVSIGRYCFFSRGCELRPPGKLYKGQFSHYTQRIADHVFVGPGTIVEAALIGSHVHIGAQCVIGKFAIIKDYVKILDGAVVPAGMVVPSFSLVAGRPAVVVTEINEGELDALDFRDIYRSVGNNS